MRSICLVLFPTLFFWFTAFLQAQNQTTWKGSSDIQFFGTSTLHNWSGKVTAEPFTVSVATDDSGSPSVLKSTVEVKAAKMNTAEPKRDENMHNDMQVKKFPLITGAFNTSFEKLTANGKTPVRLPFVLTILGEQHNIEASISHWTLKQDSAAFDLDFELSLKKCHITVPSVLLVINVGDTIRVHAPVKLVRADH